LLLLGSELLGGLVSVLDPLGGFVVP